MFKMGIRNVVFCLILFLGVPGFAAAENDRPSVASPYVPDFDGVAGIHCYCVLATSGCKSNFFWRLAGSPVHSWWQDVHLTKDQEVDLVSGCYRKRDVDGLGNSLCCAVTIKDGKPDNEMMRKFFGVSEVKPK